MKIRTDFVTNSSSSSFMLVIRIGLKNGKVLKFMGDGGVGENSEEYYELTANASPEELGQCESIDDLIGMLQRSVVQGWDTYYNEDEEPDEKVIDDNEKIIQGLKKLNSMDEIATITINGDLFGRGEQHQYKHYTYYRDKKVTVYDEGGDEYINDEGTGGHIAFCNSGKMVMGKDFGYTEVDEYTYYDDDVHEDSGDDETADIIDCARFHDLNFKFSLSDKWAIENKLQKWLTKVNNGEYKYCGDKANTSIELTLTMSIHEKKNSFELRGRDFDCNEVDFSFYGLIKTLAKYARAGSRATIEDEDYGTMELKLCRGKIVLHAIAPQEEKHDE